MRFIVLAFVAACGAQLPSSTSQVLDPTPGFTTMSVAPGAFAGAWMADSRTLTLEEHGQQVTGTIASANLSGTVQGVIEDGGKLRGGYTLGAGSGNFTATLDGSGHLQLALDGGMAVVFTHGLAGCFAKESKDRFKYEVTRETLTLDGAGKLKRERSVTRTWGDSAGATFEHDEGSYVLDGRTLRVTWRSGAKTTVELGDYKGC